MAFRELNIALTLDTSNFERAIRLTERQLSSFGQKLETIGRDLTTRVTLPIGALAVASVKAAADLDGLEKGLTAVTGSSDEAAKQIERLRKLAQLPGLDFPQAVKGSIALQSVGFNAAAAEESLGAFAKVVALTGGTADDLDQVVRQIVQINSKGKILAEDFQVIRERAPAIGIALNEAFGTNNIEAIRETGISTQEFTKKLIDGVKSAQQFQNVQGGLNNTFTNFRAAVTESLAVLGKQIITTIDLQGTIDKLTRSIQRGVEWFSALSEGTRKTIIILAGVAAAIGPVLVGIGALARVAAFAVKGWGLLTSAVLGFGKALVFLIANPVIPAVIAAIGALATVGIYVYENWEAFKARFINLWQDIVTGTQGLIKLLLEKIDNFVKKVTGIDLNLSDKIKITEFERSDLPKFKSLGESFRDFGETVKKALGLIPPAAKSAQDSLAGFAGIADFGETKTTATTKGGAGKAATRKQVDIAPLQSLQTPIAAEQLSLTSQQIETYANKIAAADLVAIGFAQRQKDVANALAQAKTAADLNTISVQQNAVAWETQKAALEKVEQQQERNAAITNALSAGITGIGDAATQAIEGTQRFATAVKKALGDLAGEILRIIILDAFKNAQQSPLAKALGPLYLPIAGAAAAAAGALVKSLVNRVKLAEGGLAFGPTAAIVGDNPNARVDPEVIAPLSKLKDLIGDGGPGYIAETRISGDDLLLLVRRAEYKNDRIR